MDIEKANSIPIAKILDKLGCILKQQENNTSRYTSPLNIEKTVTLIVNHDRNTWHDENENIYGTPISLVCLYLQRSGESYSISDALRWITNMLGYAPKIKPITGLIELPTRRKLKKLSVRPLTKTALIYFLERRGIPHELAKRYLKQVQVRDLETDEVFTTLGFQNESLGYELQSASFRDCFGKRNITFIRGNVVKPSGIHIFKNGLDYFSAMLRENNGKNFDDDAIILHCMSLLPRPTPFIKGYGYATAYSWMDNNAIGSAAIRSLSNFFRTEPRLRHKPMNPLYAGHKDVNAWHMSLQGLL